MRYLCPLLLLGFQSSIFAAERAQFDKSYAQALLVSEDRALKLLETRYAALSPGADKLYTSSLIHGLMLLNGQPYFGNKILFEEAYTHEEQTFIAALNSEESLHYDAAITSYKNLLSKAIKQKDIHRKIIYEYHLCRSLNRQGQYYQGLVYCNALNTHLRDVNNPVVPSYKALRVVANNQEFVGDYHAALETYQSLLSQFPTYQDPSGIYNDTGLLLLRLGRLEQAKEYLYTAINLRRKRSSPLLVAQVHHSLGEVLLEDKNYAAALRHFEATRQITERFEHHYGLTYALLGLGKAHIKSGAPEKGASILHQALETALSQDNSALEGEAYLSLADANMKTKRYIIASDFAVKALQLAKKHNNAHLHALSLKSLAEIAELNRDYQKALDFYQEYARYELSTRDSSHHHGFLAFDTAREELRLLSKHNDLVHSHQEQESIIASLKQTNKLYFFFFVITIGIALLVNGMRLRENRLAKHDTLTNTLGRASSIKKVKATEECKDEHCQNVLILFDLDDFKAINDEYGHPTGDRALIAITKAVKSHLKSRDLIGRIGGEEFIVLLKECEELDILDRVKAIHSGIAHSRFVSESGVSLNITASMSFLASANSLEDFDSLYSILDQALYQAKENGKNCIIDAYNEPIYLAPSAYVSNQP